jgi:hypothetical protein
MKRESSGEGGQGVMRSESNGSDGQGTGRESVGGGGPKLNKVVIARPSPRVAREITFGVQNQTMQCIAFTSCFADRIVESAI